MQAPQNVIALMSDVDLTLTPEYTQDPLLDKYKVSREEFWADVNGRYTEGEARRVELAAEEEAFGKLDLGSPPGQHRADYTKELVYANVILDYVKDGRFKGLSRKILRELGKEIQFFHGVPGFILELKEWVKAKPEWRKHDVKLEFYAISSGIADMFRGSELGVTYRSGDHDYPICDGIFATELGTSVDRVEGEIDRVDFSVSYTEKTRFIHWISKGADVDVNDPLPEEMRRVNGDCMIYLGDGPTDVPSMSTVNSFGGQNIAVYGRYNDQAKTEEAYQQALSLRKQGRVLTVCEGNYEKGAEVMMALKDLIGESAEKIVKRRVDTLSDFTGKSPSF